MLYPELFKTMEAVRWNMASDIPWDDFDGSKLSDEQAHTIKMNAITEWAALPATEMFLRDNRGDSDFCAFMSVWFFEEQKHSLVLIEYLRRFRPELMPTEEELHKVRFEFDPAPELETLMLHFCGEIRLNHWYRCAADWHTEPVIKAIYRTVAKDEARHAGAYLQYMRRALHNRGDQTSLQARQSFAKIGVLMASASRTAQASIRPTCTSTRPCSPTTRCSRACPSRAGWSTGSTPRSVSTAPGRARSPPASCTSCPSCSIASSTASRT
ncbi:P-aminobenzoate N-oxygenase AurF domain protein [Bordetella bronchiseptica SBL-F6116]|nr:P-aminobenzoate N-oxygenase AurF domain protein [Bordetella bronchiseptica SBL-F6116]